MRIGLGSVLIVLIVVVGGFGYLLYGYLDTSEELNILQQQIAQLQKQNMALQELLDKANADIDALNAHNDELEQQVLSWQEQARQLEEQNQAWEYQNAGLEAQNQFLKEQIVTLENQKQYLEARNAVMDSEKHTWKDKFADLEQQLSQTACLSWSDSKVPVNIPKTFNWMMLIPTLPMAVVLIALISRRQNTGEIQKRKRSRLNNTQRGTTVRLSKNERQEVIKMRRGL